MATKDVLDKLVSWTENPATKNFSGTATYTKVFDVSSDVSGFAEFRRVGFNKRNPDQVGNMLDQVGLSYPGRAKQ